MSKVLEFKRVEKEPEPEMEQWGQGLAFCLHCKHEWQAVAPAGTLNLECPECHTMKGKWKFEFYPRDDQDVRSCLCGNQMFYLTPEGHLCANCGIYQRYKNI